MGKNYQLISVADRSFESAVVHFQSDLDAAVDDGWEPEGQLVTCVGEGIFLFSIFVSKKESFYEEELVDQIYSIFLTDGSYFVQYANSMTGALDKVSVESKAKIQLVEIGSVTNNYRFDEEKKVWRQV